MTINNNHNKHIEILNKYFPKSSLDRVFKYININKVSLKFTRKRLYKLGDYRPPNGKHQAHRITINGDLNQYSSLLVFLHEMSHLIVWKKYNKRKKPHGKEWKAVYGSLVEEFIEKDVFPIEVKRVLEKKTHKLKASFSSDTELFRALSLFDNNLDKPVYLEDIPKKTVFIANNGKRFVKHNKLRKRYRCLCLDNKKVYLFHPLAQIKH